jgi:hypothetical protein
MLPLALTLQIILVLYHQVTTRCDFFPFNGARFYSRRERQLEAGFNLVLMSFPPIGFVFRIPFLMGAGVGYYFILLAIEIATWWIPYLFGASPKWREMHARMHSQTVMVLPRRGDNPRPNLEHLILMVLTLLAGMATLAAYHSIHGIPFRHWWAVLLIGAIPVWGTASQSCMAGRKKLIGLPN